MVSRVFGFGFGFYLGIRRVLQDLAVLGHRTSVDGTAV
jgi:hypothetical protein